LIILVRRRKRTHFNLPKIWRRKIILWNFLKILARKSSMR
jgi:hypothetical protein